MKNPPAAQHQAALLGETPPWQASDDSDGFPDFGIASTVTANELIPASPPDIPGYHIEDELGHGGMGVVYRARQLPMQRLVAIKMIRGSRYGTPADRQRFMIEAEAVSMLSHPGIVHLHLAGTLPHGDPYVVMEYVAGGSLYQKLDKKPMPWRDGAELVARIAEGVHHAHQRGVIHRDLKPSNVLMTEDSQPKIADFGLAKVAERDDVKSGIGLGTPSYMAPEQITDAKSAGTPADVYALGAILFEVLTGRPPFRGKNEYETNTQVLHDPPPGLRTLQPSAPRDLDTVCMKCLEKDPGKRYTSAAAVAAELRCVLADEPIQGRRVPAWERAWKWAKRRPAAATLVGMIAVASLVLGIAGPMIAKHQANLRARADEKTQLAHGLSDFLQNRIIGSASAAGQIALGLTPRPDLSVGEMLNSAAQQIDNQSIGIPALEADIRSALGVGYLNRGNFESAIEQFHKAVNCFDQVPNADPIKVTGAWIGIAAANQRLKQTAQFREAVNNAEAAAAGLERDETIAVTVQSFRALQSYEDGRFHEAARQFEEVLNRRRAIPCSPSDYVTDQLNLAQAWQQLGRAEDALGLTKATFECCCKHFELDDPMRFLAMHNYTGALQSLGRYEESVPLLSELVEARKRILGLKHRDTLESLNNFAASLIRVNRKAEAVEPLQQIISIVKVQYPLSHPMNIAPTSLLGETLLDLGKPKQAEEILQPVSVELEKKHSDHIITFAYRSMLGDALRQQHKLDEAEPLLISGWEGTQQRIDRVAEANRSRVLGQTLKRLIALYDDLKQPDEAAKYRTKLAEFQPPTK